MRNDRNATAHDDECALERAWLAATAEGDRVAFEHLYRQHHERLVRFLARHTARRELIGEIVNETFWVVWRKAGEFRGEAKVGTWIVAIAYRCLMKALRDPTALAFTGDEGLPAADADVLGNDQRELRDWVQGGLRLLPAEQRMTIEFAYFLGLSCEEIATVMNVAVGTVKARMFHARVRLRNTLPTLGGDATAERSAGESA